MDVDPTNANAVAGPSRLLATDGVTAAAAAASAAAPPRPTGDAASEPQLADNGPVRPVQPGEKHAAPSRPPSVRRDPVRRAEGPIIVPTQVTADGVRTVPQQFENCQLEDLITLIASMLDRLIEHNDRIPLTSNSLTRFHSRAPPNISVRDYLLRIAKYTNVEPCCLLILLPYVDKACARITSFTISSLTVHRFIIAAISVGSKALSDAFCTNGRYARVGGISIVEMNLLEKEFCEALDWRLTTSGPVLAHYYTSLVRSHPRYNLSTAPPPSPPPPAPIRIPSPLPASTAPKTSTPPSNPASQQPPNGRRSSRPLEHGSARTGVMQVDTPPVQNGESATAEGCSRSNSSSSGSFSGGGSSSLASTSTSSPAQVKSRSRPSPRTANSHPHPHSHAHASSTTAAGAEEPPLFPPNLTRHVSDTGSNLPSPARGAEHTPPPISGQGSGAGAAGGGGTVRGSEAAVVRSGGSGLRPSEGGDLFNGGGGERLARSVGAKRGHDRMRGDSSSSSASASASRSSSRSRSRDRRMSFESCDVADAGGAGGRGRSQQYYAGRGVSAQSPSQQQQQQQQPHVSSPLAHSHAGAGARRSDSIRLGKSPRLAFAAAGHEL